MIKLTLPWPPKELSPNARQHWSKLAKAKKAYRAMCTYEAMSQGVRGVKAEKLHISLTFVRPTRRAYDQDNLIARMKSGLDGLATVLGVDDRHWSFEEISVSEKTGGAGHVLVEVTHAG